MDILRHIFKRLNRYWVVPIYRMGLAWLFCNPVTGYVMVIRNIGRKSGKLYHTPTNYAIMDGRIYCLSGFGRKAHWFLNLTDNPKAEVILPGRAIMGKFEEVKDPEEALRATRQVLKNAGFAGFFEGYNPWTAEDENFQETLARAPVLRITPVGLGSGPMDAGGWHWLAWAIATAVVLVIFLAR